MESFDSLISNTPSQLGGTKGFEAPEILNGKFCSTKSDAYAVGKTIRVMLEAFLEEARGSYEFGILHDVALQLTRPDPQARWSLNQALIAIQNIMFPGNDSSSLIMHAMTAANPEWYSVSIQEAK